jgi:multidrug transporter EmrE-like cation transporter
MLFSISNSKNLAKTGNAISRLGVVPSSNIGVNSCFALWRGEGVKVTKIVAVWSSSPFFHLHPRIRLSQMLEALFWEDLNHGNAVLKWHDAFDNNTDFLSFFVSYGFSIYI